MYNTVVSTIYMHAFKPKKNALTDSELNDIKLLCKLKELSNDFVVYYDDFFYDEFNNFNLVIEYCDVII